MASSEAKEDSDTERNYTDEQPEKGPSSTSDDKPTAKSTRRTSDTRQRTRPSENNTQNELTDLHKILHLVKKLQSINVDNATEIYQSLAKDAELKGQPGEEGEVVESEKELLTRIRDGKDKLLTENDLREWENEKQKLMQENAELRTHQNEVGNQQGVIQQLQNEVESLRVNIQRTEADLRRVESEKSAEIRRVESERSSDLRRVRAEKAAEIKRVEADRTAELRKLEAEKESAIRKIQEEKDAELRRYQEERATELSQTEAERSDTLTRLTDQTDAKLNDEHPTISNLSGPPNKSVNLKEKYNQLHDEQWADALESLVDIAHFDEETGVEKLLDILTKCYKICTDIANKQMKTLQMSLVNPGAILKEWEEQDDTIEGIEDSTLNALKGCRKEVSVTAVQNIYEQHVKHHDDLLVDQIPDYVQKCVELCWLMCVQDPPVVFGSQATVGEKLDTNMFRRHTNKGTVVLYNVWPPLLLEEDGRLLVKGVVQTTEGEAKPKRRTEPARITPTTVAETKSKPYRASSKTVYKTQYRSKDYDDDSHYLYSRREPPLRSREVWQDSQFSDYDEPYRSSSLDISSRYRDQHLTGERKLYSKKQSPHTGANYKQHIVRPKKDDPIYFGGKLYYERDGEFYDYFTDSPFGISS